MTRYIEDNTSHNKISSDGLEDKGYCQVRTGSLEELGVFHSGGLANQTLDSPIGVSVEMDGVDERAPSSKLQKAAHKGNLPHLHMVLQLSSPMTSGEESINPASTHKYSDSRLSDDVVFANNLSGTIHQNYNKEGYVEFTATFMQKTLKCLRPLSFGKGPLITNLVKPM